MCSFDSVPRGKYGFHSTGNPQWSDQNAENESEGSRGAIFPLTMLQMLFSKHPDDARTKKNSFLGDSRGANCSMTRLHQKVITDGVNYTFQVSAEVLNQLISASKADR